MYKCVVVSTTGERYTVDAMVGIQRKPHYQFSPAAISNLYIAELMHTIEVTSSSTSAVPAGGVVTLTCRVVSNVPTQLSWTDHSGPVTSGAGVSIITDDVDQQTTESTLAFHPLTVSHAGQYNCRSTLQGIASVQEANMIVSVQGKIIRSGLYLLYMPPDMHVNVNVQSNVHLRHHADMIYTRVNADHLLLSYSSTAGSDCGSLS